MNSLWEWVDRWAASVESMTDDQLDVPGFGAYPYGLDARDPVHRDRSVDQSELIHHLAEVALMRDF